jgi:hypothetical protein
LPHLVRKTVITHAYSQAIKLAWPVIPTGGGGCLFAISAVFVLPGVPP